mmetsp:Transcript_272/g.586  ORF Transcript_272/g.586 Transcript_272/m.586 type:complete len:278 (-) Transcript_272:499-1332(-)
MPHIHDVVDLACPHEVCGHGQHGPPYGRLLVGRQSALVHGLGRCRVPHQQDAVQRGGQHVVRVGRDGGEAVLVHALQGGARTAARIEPHELAFLAPNPYGAVAHRFHARHAVDVARQVVHEPFGARLHHKQCAGRGNPHVVRVLMVHGRADQGSLLSLALLELVLHADLIALAIAKKVHVLAFGQLPKHLEAGLAVTVQSFQRPDLHHTLRGVMQPELKVRNGGTAHNILADREHSQPHKRGCVPQRHLGIFRERPIAVHVVCDVDHARRACAKHAL